MKITKAQLKEIVRKVVRKKLQEMDMSERKLPKGVPAGADKRMSPDELKTHLEKEKEESKRRKAQKQRAAMKATSRGMELERCGDPHVVSDEEDERDEEEEYLSRLERAILRSEEERLG